MKIYFINPDERSLTLYYSNYPDNTDVNSMSRINIGYNDSYEMRSQFLPKGYFSNDPTKLEEILAKRKEKIVADAYKLMIEKLEYYNKVKDTTGSREYAVLHDDIDAPF